METEGEAEIPPPFVPEVAEELAEGIGTAISAGAAAVLTQALPRPLPSGVEAKAGIPQTADWLSSFLKERDAKELRRVFFAGIATSLLLLIALALRDLIAGVVKDVFPGGGVKNRLFVFLSVAGVAAFLVLIIYKADLDR